MPAEVKPIFEFGPYRLDVVRRQLKCAGQPVPLTPKLFELLVYLLENRGRALSKDELLNKVWPDSFVSEENLSRHISPLRKTLSQEPDGLKYIETLPKTGYRFTEQVTLISAPAAPTPAQLPIRILPDGVTASSESAWLSESAWSRPADVPNADEFPRVLFEREVTSVSAVHPARLRFGRHWLWAALACLVLLCVCGAFWLTLRQPKTGAPLAKVAPLTSFPGRENYPAFSPDDRQLAFTWDGEQGGTTDIYVKLLGTDTPLRLTTNPADEISPVWSPDGLSLAFMRITTSGAGIYLIPALGGPERELLTGIWSDWTNVPSGRLCWSPDGQFIAFAGTEAAAQANLHLFLLAVNGLEKRQLTADAEDDRCPVFSPDGQTLAFIRGWDEIYLIPTAGGEARRLTFDNKRIYGLAWTPDGREIIFSSARGGSPSLWKIAFAGGTPEAVQPSGEQVSNLALNHQGTQLAYTQNIRDLNLWQLELADPSAKPKAPTLFFSSTRQESQPQFSPDGKRVVFVSGRSGQIELWTCESAGQNAVQLTQQNGPFAGSPRWSPDGTQIAFETRGNQHQPDIYVIAAEGGKPPRRFTTEDSEDIRPSWSHDGKWLYFCSNRSGSFQLWKQPVAGGPAVQLTRQGGREAYEAPDSQFVYYTRSTNEPGIWRVPVNGGEETRVLEQGRQGAWAVQQEGIFLLYATGNGKSAIEFFSFATAKKATLTAIGKDDIYGFTVTPDGRRLLWSQIDRNESDLVLLENFR
jgi:Tol biopolymer transport system component/DNA-binding winged helix-turn-helix (wHTH) protein